MRLNDLKPAPGSVKARKRVGRGVGSGFGKTCGRGHKGQKARSGGGVRPGFEGGQMPLQMRLPKFGFSSRIGRVTAEVRTGELNRVEAEAIDLAALRKAGLITANIKRARVMLSGEVNKPLTVQGLRVSKGARAAIEAAGGKVIGDWDSTVESEPEKKAEKKPAKKAKAKPAAAEKAEPRPEPEAEPKAKPAAAEKAKPKPEPEAEPKAKPAVKAKAKSKPKPKPKPEAKAEPEAVAKAEPATAAEDETKAETPDEPAPKDGEAE